MVVNVIKSKIDIFLSKLILLTVCFWYVKIFYGDDMKKAKNSILLIGIIFNFGYIVLQLFKFIYHCVTVLPNNGTAHIEYFLTSDLLPILILLVLMLLPVVLFILNLRNKAGKVLPIISAVMCGVVSLLMIFSLVTPAIPQYITYSKLALIDTYFVIILDFFTNGGILYFIGFVLLTVGSITSLIKSKV